jgi:hypothetical protein
MIIVVTHFWVPTHKRRKYKKKIKNIYSKENKKNNSSEKRMSESPENSQKLKFDSICFIDERPVDKKNSI